MFPFTPTPAGRAIYPDVKSLVLSETVARKKLASMNDDHQGTVRIGAYAVHLESLLGVLLHEFRDDYPLIAVERASISPPEASNQLDELLWQRCGPANSIWSSAGTTTTSQSPRSLFDGHRC